MLLFNILVLILFAKNLNPYGLPLVVFGLFMYFHSKREMRDAWSIKVEKKDKIITSGFFRHIRHPLYTGLLLSGFGAAISTTNFPLIASLIFITMPFIYKRALLEEKFMDSRAYRDYKKRTGMFFPKSNFYIK